MLSNYLLLPVLVHELRSVSRTVLLKPFFRITISAVLSGRAFFSILLNRILFNLQNIGLTDFVEIILKNKKGDMLKLSKPIKILTNLKLLNSDDLDNR